MNKQQKIIELAKKKAAKIRKLRKDPRYKKVIGRLKYEGLLDAPITPVNRKLYLDEAIWVGENVEPRVLELLPAIILKRPGIFVVKDFPAPLLNAANQLRKGEISLKYRGIPLRRCEQWLPYVGHKGKLPSTLKSFRLPKEDLEILKILSNKFGINETSVISKALRELSKNI